ncbi:mortality factor 4-like protein 1 [Anopheles ziemanni]|uniref:mortality factor 4-like protein 1 n=1 Tax=Anopheles coustani TaxID=139045 RepID=UPI002658D009|nr:mortality factor 4-like protein 1 [Anopheles coustani]XP_058172045.1 mortality factor 4-like protein 1 [Anopheles ziemanni]
MPPKLKFTEGEKVLCFHGPLLYEAKMLKSAIMKDKQVKYFIHYAGWNKNWDEWVPENRVLKYNEANCQRQREVTKLHSPLVKNKKSNTKAKKTDAQGTGSSQSKDNDSRASTPSKEVAKEKDATAPAVTSTVTTPTTASAATSGSAAANASSTGRNRSAQKTTAPSVSASSSSSSSSSSTSSSSVAATAGGKDGKPSEGKDVTEKSKEEPSSEINNSRTKKRGRSDTTSSNVESEDQFMSKVEVKIKIPDELKPWLVDDWDAISRQNKLLELPAKVTVQEIVDNYVQYKKQSKVNTATKETAVTDIGNGIIEYFNVMLGSQLLYKFERPQYAEIIQSHPGVPMAKIYGSFHLLRLFVKLGSMLAFTSLDEKSIQTLIGHVQDFLKYLVKNSSTLFNMQHYVNTSPEYHRKAQ